MCDDSGVSECSPDNSQIEPKRASDVLFCHDYQNPGGCRRKFCRFIHGTKAEEASYRQNNQLPTRLAEQISSRTKYTGPDSSDDVSDNNNSINNYNICRDFMFRGSCVRGRLCKFRHLTQSEFDFERSQKPFEPVHIRPPENPWQLSPEQSSCSSHTSFLDDSHLRKRPYSSGSMSHESSACSSHIGAHPPQCKYPAVRYPYSGRVSSSSRHEELLRLAASLACCPDSNSQPHRRPEAASVCIAALEAENSSLRRKLRELEHVLHDYKATNDLLLDQNARIRSATTTNYEAPPHYNDNYQRQNSFNSFQNNSQNINPNINGPGGQYQSLNQPPPLQIERINNINNQNIPNNLTFTNPNCQSNVPYTQASYTNQAPLSIDRINNQINNPLFSNQNCQTNVPIPNIPYTQATAPQVPYTNNVTVQYSPATAPYTNYTTQYMGHLPHTLVNVMPLPHPGQLPSNQSANQVLVGYGGKGGPAASLVGPPVVTPLVWSPPTLSPGAGALMNPPLMAAPGMVGNPHMVSSYGHH